MAEAILTSGWKGARREDPPASSDMPLTSTKVIGSAGRQTIIRPIDDIDVLAVFRNKNNVYRKYAGDSKQFLYRVRDALIGSLLTEVEGWWYKGSGR